MMHGGYPLAQYQTSSHPRVWVTPSRTLSWTWLAGKEEKKAGGANVVVMSMTGVLSCVGGEKDSFDFCWEQRHAVWIVLSWAIR